MAVLTLNGLAKCFGEKEVLRGVTLSVPPRSIFGFVGKNGAGKTTVMKIVLGLLKADAGEALVMGEPVTYGSSATNRYIGYLPDVPAFYDFFTASEYLRFCGDCLGLSREENESRGRELLSLVGLGGEHHRLKGYSRGMKQRLGIAQALLGRPSLLLCDEPTSALDPIGRREILDLLNEVKEQTTVLFSTHILSDVERICSDVALLHEGQIALQGPVRELKTTASQETVTVELTPGDSGDALLRAFPGAVLSAEHTVTVVGGEEMMRRLMAFLAESSLPIRRIERTEPSLESLLLEVMTR